MYKYRHLYVNHSPKYSHSVTLCHRQGRIISGRGQGAKLRAKHANFFLPQLLKILPPPWRRARGQMYSIPPQKINEDSPFRSYRKKFHALLTHFQGGGVEFRGGGQLQSLGGGAGGWIFKIWLTVLEISSLKYFEPWLNFGGLIEPEGTLWENTLQFQKVF